MPEGSICQLHYVGGGTVQFQEASGSWVRLPFLHAPSLRIGDKVRFSVSPAGEARGVQVLQPGVEAEAGVLLQPVWQEADCQQAPLAAKRHAKEAEALNLQTPAWKLQRCIGRFQNANLEGRLDMLSRAEATLKHLLLQADVDGDAICKLVRRVVGWLQAPRFLKQMAGTSSGSPEAGGASDLQCRIRRLLISALSNLDLTDSTTKRAVETAVAYIGQLIQDVSLTDLETLQAASQWRKLQSLISTGAVAPLPVEDGPKRLARSETLRGENTARIVDGAFSPNVRVRQLPSVFAGDPVRLTCPSCPASITSRWWWRHPKTHAIYLLVPHNGCYHKGRRDRRAKADATSRWRPVFHACPTKEDTFPSLDFCHHQRQRNICKECGGYSICSHSRQRHKCRLCKSQKAGVFSLIE